MAQTNSKTIDMTTGSIIRTVLLFAIPICLGNVLQQLYSTVDTLIIGRFCSSDSLAAIGTSSQPTELLINFFVGFGGGVSILVSQFKGADDMKKLVSVVKTATFFLFSVSLPVMILGQFVGPVILRFMNTPEDIWEMAVSYVSIMFWVTIASLGYNMNAGILRGMGDSRASLVFLCISCVVNIVLDLVFIAGLQMDVFGAALATAIAIVASWIFSIVYIKVKFPELDFSFLPRGFDRDMLKKIVSIGLPLGLNHSIYSVGHIVLQALTNLQGPAFIAGCSVAGKVNGLANMAITSLATSATTFSGQNYGAGKLDRLRKGAWMIPLTNALITATAGMLMAFVFCEPIIGLFSTDPEVLFVASRYVHIVLPFSWCYSVLSTIINYCNGAGVITYPTIINILMLWAVRIPVGCIITFLFDGTYVMIAYPVSFVFGMTCMVLFLFTKTWKRVTISSADKMI